LGPGRSTALFLYVLWSAAQWRFPAGLMPQTVAAVGLAAIAASALVSLVEWQGHGWAPQAEPRDPDAMWRTIVHALWFFGLVVGVLFVGMLPAIGIFMLAYMIVEGRTHPVRAVAIVLPFWAGAYFLFHEVMNTPWPRSLLGDAFPAIRALAGRGLI
jgi:putative tricarboxylic transport membrane protein